MPKRTYQPSTKKRVRKSGYRAQKKKKSGKKDDPKIKGKNVIRARSAKGRKRQAHSNHPRYK
jgi:ribosomal protein L34